MYNILRELCEITDVSFDEINKQTKIFWYSGVVVVNEYKRLLTYTNENIVVSTKNNRLNIEGTNIIIKQISKNELIVKGNISKVYFEK